MGVKTMNYYVVQYYDDYGQDVFTPVSGLMTSSLAAEKSAKLNSQTNNPRVAYVVYNNLSD